MKTFLTLTFLISGLAHAQNAEPPKKPVPLKPIKIESCTEVKGIEEKLKVSQSGSDIVIRQTVESFVPFDTFTARFFWQEGDKEKLLTVRTGYECWLVSVPHERIKSNLKLHFAIKTGSSGYLSSSIKMGSVLPKPEDEEYVEYLWRKEREWQSVAVWPLDNSQSDQLWSLRYFFIPKPDRDYLSNPDSITLTLLKVVRFIINFNNLHFAGLDVDLRDLDQIQTELTDFLHILRNPDVNAPKIAAMLESKFTVDQRLDIYGELTTFLSAVADPYRKRLEEARQPSFLSFKKQVGNVMSSFENVISKDISFHCSSYVLKPEFGLPAVKLTGFEFAMFYLQRSINAASGEDLARVRKLLSILSPSEKKGLTYAQVFSDTAKASEFQKTYSAVKAASAAGLNLPLMNSIRYLKVLPRLSQDFVKGHLSKALTYDEKAMNHLLSVESSILPAFHEVLRLAAQRQDSPIRVLQLIAKIDQVLGTAKNLRDQQQNALQETVNLKSRIDYWSESAMSDFCKKLKE